MLAFGYDGRGQGRQLTPTVQLVNDQSVSPYVLTTPVLDEINELPSLVQSIDRQTAPPALWLVVDDGSRDGSREWLEQAAASRPFMVVKQAPEKGDEYLGAHVARIKRWGLEQALAEADRRGLRSDYAGVLDADIELPEDHYARLCQALREESKLGIVSSLIVSRRQGKTIVEPYQREDLPRGGTQFFRRECLKQIGGLPPWPAFDAASNVKARTLGWETRLLSDIVAVQRRETATRYGVASGYARKGRYAWFLGVHPLLIGLRAAAYSVPAPHTAGFYFLKAYLRDALARSPRCPDPEVRRHYGMRRVLEVVKAATRLGPGYVTPGSDAGKQD